MSTMSLDVSRTAHTPFARLVSVELRKTYDTRAGLWLLITIAALVMVAEGILLAITLTQDEPVALGDFIGVAAFVTSILLPVLGILLVTSEWGQRTAMVTFALEPRRPLVVLAKLVTGVVLTLLTAAFAIAIGLVGNLVAVTAQGEGSWEFGWNYFGGFLVVQTLAMTSGFALAALLLNTPAAIVVFFMYRYVLPGLFFAGAQFLDWFADLRPWIDFMAAQVPLEDLSLDTGEEWAHLLVSGALWLGLPLLFGVRRILRAEIK